MWNRVWNLVGPTAKYSLIAISVANTFFGLIGSPFYQIDGESMNPTLKDSDWVFANRWSIQRTPLNRGDIVVFISHRDPQRHIIKRIVGLEGDIIRNDKYSSREVVIPRGHCWVEGDNTAASSDSIKYGPIPLALVYAKATHVRRLWKTEAWCEFTNVGGNTTPPISAGGSIVVPEYI